MLDVFLDSLFDSLKILALVFATEVLLSFFEGKLAKLLEKSNRFAPALGAVFGIVPQCGVSVVTADLYEKKHLTLGTVVAVFLACSDEALPILFGNFTPNFWLTFVLIGAKVAIGAMVGTLVDLFAPKQREEVKEHDEACAGEKDLHYGCCGHEIEQEKESPVHEHLLHPIVHSLKIFAYCLVISFAFGTMVYYIGQDKIAAFLEANRYLSPLLAILIGLIPNCVSSVLLSELFLEGALPFGALLAGLLVNAGLGMWMLFRKKANLKSAFLVLGICLATSIAFGYLFLFAMPMY